jgi:2-succinyl-5-enolpyruvyl-6-hydroxy-3-cyclohexene-1-carboxylate synthase
MTMQQHVFTMAQTCEAAGVEHAIICPGSRSAPLVYAFTHSRIQCHSVVDERSAGYIALGIAQQTGKPVVLICTSGTATLNFFPAIAEAFYQHIPLLVLTADRPPELLNQQDGQMIMQKGVYDKHVKLSFETPCYAPGKENRSETQKIFTEALNASMSGAKGPVHINIPLTEPLYPEPKKPLPQLPKLPVITIGSEYPAITTNELSRITTTWKNAHKKMVLVGQNPCDAQLTAALQELKDDGETIIVCDILSNQHHYNTAPLFDYLLLKADAKTLEELAPDCIISLGGPILSKPFKKWLKQLKPTTHIRFNETGWPVDTYQNITRSIEGNAAPVLVHLALHATQTSESNRFKLFWEQANQLVVSSVNRYLAQSDWNELTIVNTLLRKMPDAVNLQIGNSSVIRYISYVGKTHPSWVLDGNRGTSGIDGCTSTAVGAALVNNRPTFLFTGDLAFLYDNNALWNGLPENLKIIVLNNEGGGIFQLIDGPGKHKNQLDYFTTPHKQNIEAWANAKGIRHEKAGNMDELLKLSSRFFDPASPAGILEIKVNRDENARAFDEFKQFPL